MESSTYKRYLWIFFGLLLGVMAASYIINTLTTPQPAKPRGFDNELGTAYVTVHDTDGNLILQTGVNIVGSCFDLTGEIKIGLHIWV